VTRNQDALTRVWAAELGPRDDTVNAVAPRPGGYSDAEGSHRPDGRGGGEGNGLRARLWITGQVLDTTGGLAP
jgi:NAD(P)-dependent dehydrogenase (short-subunit alcohol dehydrogenase family)